MAKANTTTEDAGAQAVPEDRVSLEAFCARLSETVARPELIGGFYFSEKAARRLHDTPSAYRERYDAFINQPA